MWLHVRLLSCSITPFIREKECIGTIGIGSGGVGGVSISEASVAPIVAAFFFAGFYNKYQQ